MGVELKGCRTLVTGASSGIGAGLAEALAAQGAIVGICARRGDRLAEVVGRCMEHSPDSRMWVVDLADPDAVDQLSVDVLDAFGGIDLLVNNAGIPKRCHVTALSIDTITQVMHINFLSPMRLTVALLPQMLARGSGTIVNVSSIAALLSAPGEAAYDASKAALSAFSEAMAVDLWDTGVKVMVVYPGVIDTDLFSLPDNDVPNLPVPAEPVSVAVDAILDGLASKAVQVFVPEYFAEILRRQGTGCRRNSCTAPPHTCARSTESDLSTTRRWRYSRTGRSRVGTGNPSRGRSEARVKVDPDAAGHERGAPGAHHPALRRRLRGTRKDRRMPDHRGAQWAHGLSPLTRADGSRKEAPHGRRRHLPHPLHDQTRRVRGPHAALRARDVPTHRSGTPVHPPMAHPQGERSAARRNRRSGQAPRPMNVRDVLMHTTGLPGGLFPGNPIDDAFAEARRARARG
jgi:short-subunit dehydrogenase